MPKESDYWIGKPKRSVQVYRWFNDVVFSNNLSFFYDEIGMLISQNKTELALNRFKQLVFLINSGGQFGENGDILGTLIGYNMDRFGVNTVILDLFNGIITVRFRIRKTTKKPKKVSKVSLKEVEKEIETKTVTKLGINVEGKREQAIIRIRKNGSLWLQSKTTGRILKQTKAFRKEVEERRVEEK